MTRIHLDLLSDAYGGPVTTTGALLAHRTAIRVDGSVVTYPGEIRFPLPGPVDLDPPLAGEAWTLDLYSGTSRPIFRTVTFIGDDIDWADLTDVDPRTLSPLPIGEQLAAWDAVREHLDELLAGGLTDGPDLTLIFENGLI